MRRKKILRLGGYGDPAMLPEKDVAELVDNYDGWLGYTHQWQKPWAQWARRYCMASVDHVAEMIRAQSRGWRTFRVSYDGFVAKGEIVCPNTTNGVQCMDCGLCDGARSGDKRKSIVILAHGSKSNKLMEV